MTSPPSCRALLKNVVPRQKRAREHDKKPWGFGGVSKHAAVRRVSTGA